MKSHSRIKPTFAAAAVTGLLALGASAQETPQDGVYKDHIDWGVQMDMSGPTAESQSTWVKGFQDYMRKINVLAEDGRYNAAQDKISYEKLD